MVAAVTMSLLTGTRSLPWSSNQRRSRGAWRPISGPSAITDKTSTTLSHYPTRSNINVPSETTDWTIRISPFHRRGLWPNRESTTRPMRNMRRTVRVRGSERSRPGDLMAPLYLIIGSQYQNAQPDWLDEYYGSLPLSSDSRGRLMSLARSGFVAVPKINSDGKGDNFPQ